MAYLWMRRISSLSATQFMVEKLDFCDSQQLTEVAFVVQLQTLHKILHQQKTFENLTVELDATNIK